MIVSRHARAIFQNKCDLAKDPSIPSGEALQQFVTDNRCAHLSFPPFLLAASLSGAASSRSLKRLRASLLTRYARSLRLPHARCIFTRPEGNRGGNQASRGRDCQKRCCKACGGQAGRCEPRQAVGGKGRLLQLSGEARGVKFGRRVALRAVLIMVWQQRHRMLPPPTQQLCQSPPAPELP